VEESFLGCSGATWKKLDHTPCTQEIDLLDEHFHEITANSVYSTQPAWAPAWTANKHASTSSSEWTTKCLQTVGAGGPHWLRVDFGHEQTVTSFGVHGYAGGSHKPTGTWSLQGSNDDSTWTNVWSGGTAEWYQLLIRFLP